MKISVVCSPGLGDAVILQIVSHHLQKAGFEVTTVTNHRFGRWVDGYWFSRTLGSPDAIYLQHGNDPKSYEIQKLGIPLYIFYGSYKESKHGPLDPKRDYVCDLNLPMVANVQRALQHQFGIAAAKENGFSPPKGLVHRKHSKRVLIHKTSGNTARNWPEDNFQTIAKWLQSKGFNPVYLSEFGNLEELTSYIYESGYFLGNDSGPGHIASCLAIPNLIIGRDEKHMRHWRPGWELGEIVVPPRWVPNFKHFRLRETLWKRFITPKKVIKSLESNVLNN